MLEEKDNSDGSMGSPSTDTFNKNSHITWKTSLTALLYKSVKNQQRNLCSNFCQILTPLLCVLFTLVVKLISQELIVMKVQLPAYPRPLNMPLLYDLLPLNLSCEEIYLFNYDGKQRYEESQKMATTLLNNNLKRYCERTHSLQPNFTYTNDMNNYILDVVKTADKQSFNHGEQMKDPIPDGIAKFHAISIDPGSKKKINVTVGINDYRLSEYHRNNGVTKIAYGSEMISYVMTTEGMMSMIEKITRPFLQQITGKEKEIIFGSYMYMPFSGQDTTLLDKTVNVIGSGLYPLGLSLLLPLFLYAIVSEKEEKLIEIMRMNGLNIKYYWISTFIFNFCISMVTFTIFFIFGRFILELNFFVETHAGLMWLTLIGWAIAQISMTNLVQIFISNGKSATIIGYLLSIFSALVGETIAVFIYAYPLTIPFFLLLYPPFCLCRIIYLMGIACSSTGCFNSVTNSSPQIHTCILILYMWFFVFLLSIWLDSRVQQEYGVASQSKILTTLSNIIERMCVWRKQKPPSAFQFELKEEKDMSENIEERPQYIQKYHESVEEMRNQIDSMGNMEKLLMTKNLMKKYETSNGKDDYVALKPLSIAIENNEIFGLLGPNGAGKTTLISVLTGMYPKSSGNAWINGVEVGKGQVNEYIGVCPQFDLLWPSLTVYEHLYFYATLKGVEADSRDDQINQSLREVDLLQWKDTPSRQLSGGMQRRLSISIALVANPSVAFLDEPSSGLDPSHRRKLWDILLRCKKRTSIILTTHLMEQAEALCERIGIIHKGDLKCIGETQKLKESLGEGYRIHINFIDILSDKNELLIEEMVSKFDGKVLSRLDRRVILKVEKERIFKCVSRLKEEQSINWFVSQASLYDVFMNFVQ